MRGLLHDIDWSDLKTFLWLARSSTVADAAAQLGVDATTIRRRLTALENAVGLSLFTKQGRSLRLSSDGERIYAIALQMETLSHDIANNAADASRDLLGLVRISTMEAFGSYYLAERLSDFLVTHPQLSVQLVTAAHLLNLAEREADISLNMVKPQRGRLNARKVGQFTIGLYGSPSYLDRVGVPASLTSLTDHDFVTYVDDLVVIPHVRYLSEVVEEPRSRLACSSLVAQLQATRSGAGLAMIPHFMAVRDPGLVRVLPNEINLVRDWWLVVHPELEAVPRIRATVDFLTRVMVRDRDILMS